MEEQEKTFDESLFIDRLKISCMLCRRQFANLETLNKHVQISELHKVLNFFLFSKIKKASFNKKI